MSIGHLDPDLASRLPLERIAEACKKYGVSELWISGPIPEGDDDEVLFLVEFHGDDAGPWMAKFDLLENDLSGLMHRKVHVASRGGIEQSASPIRREWVLGNARKIYES